MPKTGENIYKRKDGRWEARFISGRKPDGRAKYMSVYARTYYPILFYKNQHYGAVMLYGHVHNTSEWELVEKWKKEQWAMGIPSRLINVGCMMAYMNYTPRTLDELLEANPQPMIKRIRKDGTNAGENSNGEL